MLTLQSPVSENPLPRPNPTRRPLQPIKPTSNLPPIHQKPHPNLGCIDISEDSNKENPNPNPNPKPYPNLIKNEKGHLTCNLDQDCSPICTVAAAPVQIEQFEVSLADELSAIREKMERLKADKEKTEKMLKEREMMMEMKMKELDQRGEIQKVLEIEVDRLYRLNELKSLCNRIMPIRSLREKEQEKIKPDRAKGEKVEEREEEKGQ